MNFAGRRAQLERSILFMGLPEAVLVRVLEAATSVTAAARSVLFHQGDAPERLILLADGLAKMSRVGDSGDPSIIRIMHPGDVLGCVAVFRRAPHPVSATTITDSSLLTWPAPWVLDALERYPALRANSVDLVGHRSEDLVQRLHEMATERVEQRAARALLRLAGQAGKAGGGRRVELGLPVSRQDLAELVGTDLFVISRLLRKWAAMSLLTAERLRITLLDPGGLERIAEGHERTVA